MAKKRKKDAEPLAAMQSDAASAIITDPFGSYTGITVTPDDIPIQDADDL